MLSYTTQGDHLFSFEFARRLIASLLAACTLVALPAYSQDHPGPKAAAVNYTSLWWNPDESGWGLNVNQQGDTLFATLFTYDTTGAPLWLVMSNGALQADGSYKGDLFLTNGPAFNAVPFTPLGAGNLSRVGSMTLAFSSPTAGTLTYTVNSITVTKAIQQQVFGAAPATCVATSASRKDLTNYQDLWWNPSESGWGLNLTQQGNTIFGTLFTYDAAGHPLWLVMSAGQKQSDGSYAGDLYRTTGSPFYSQPFPPIGAANLAKVGTMSLRFSDGETGTLTYSVDGAPVTKAITRQVFGATQPACSSPVPPPPGTAKVCRQSNSFFSTGCDPVTLPYSSFGSESATVIGASTVTLDTFTLTAQDGAITITLVAASDDNGVVSPFVSGISQGMVLQAGQSVTFSFTSPLTHGRTASPHYVVSVNGSIALDVHYVLTTN